jgi:glycosyltransferase involved in cell wall biosynthesis
VIGVIIPSYRRPKQLEVILRSIAEQTLPPSEVIVVDDASNMDAAYEDCIASFHKSIPTLTYIRLQQNSGAPHARNVGISKAKSTWLALVDDDDEWLPDKLAAQWEVAKKADPSLGLIYTWTHAVGQGIHSSYDSTPYIMGDGRKAILQGNFMLSPSVIVRREAILKAGLFDETLPSCQDWDMWTRIFFAGYTCYAVPKFLAIYNRHDEHSIGVSRNALLGHLMFFKKHWFKMWIYGGPSSIMKFSLGIWKLWIRK